MQKRFLQMVKKRAQSLRLFPLLVCIGMLLPAAGWGQTELDVSKGSIIFTESGYTQGDATGNAGSYIITQADPATPTANKILVKSGTHNITLRGVNIEVKDGSHDTYSAFDMTAEEDKTVTVNLTLEGENRLVASNSTSGTDLSNAGLRVCENSTLIITQQSSGSLYAQGGRYRDSKATEVHGAGIGGSFAYFWGKKAGKIKIEGGIIEADSHNPNIKSIGGEQETVDVTISNAFVKVDELMEGTSITNSIVFDWTGYDWWDAPYAGTVYGTYTLTKEGAKELETTGEWDININADTELIIENGVELTNKKEIKINGTLTNNGTIVNNETGTIYIGGTLVNNGVINNDAGGTITLNSAVGGRYEGTPIPSSLTLSETVGSTIYKGSPCSFTYEYKGDKENQVTIEIEQEKVATIQEDNGTITVMPKNAGTATITVSAAAKGVYAASSAEYQLTVEKAVLTAEDFVFTAPQDLVYTGKALDVSNLVAIKSGLEGVGKITEHYHYFYNQQPADEIKNAMKYLCYISVEEGDNYKGTDEMIKNNSKWEFQVSKATPAITLTVPTDNLVYDGTDKKATATVQGVEGESEKLEATITFYSDDSYANEVEETKDAGTYYVKATFDGTNNYKSAEATGTFTVAKATAALSYAETAVEKLVTDAPFTHPLVNESNVAVTYSSSNPAVATVNETTGEVSIVAAGETTVTATVADANYQGEPASYMLKVSLAQLPEGSIVVDGNGVAEIEMGSEGCTLIASVTGRLGTGGTWSWSSTPVDVVEISEAAATRAATTSESRRLITPKSEGTAVITATYTDSKYTGAVNYTITVKAKEAENPDPEPEEPVDPDPISYYNIYVEDVCNGVEVTTSKNVVREGNSVSVYVEKDTARYTFDNFKVYIKRSYYGYWEEVKEGTQPGEYPINNIWTDIYIKAEGAEEKEDPTGIESIEGVKVYTKDGSLYVQTPQREQVIIVSMTGAVVKNEEQVGLKQYHGLQPGIYIVRVGDRAYKLRLN